MRFLISSHHKLGSKKINAASSDEGSIITPSQSATSVADEGIPTTSVRMTRGRRSSLLTEENVATLSPVRRSRRRSHLSDDISSIPSVQTVQKGTPVKKGTPIKKGTPAQKDTPSVEETASNKIITRNVSVVLTHCSPRTTENEKEAVVKADENTVEQIIKDPVETIEEVPEPIEFNALPTPPNPNVLSNFGIESETTPSKNVWAPRPASNIVNLNETEYMDVDIIDISSTSEDSSSNQISENLMRNESSNKVPVDIETAVSTQSKSSADYSEEREVSDEVTALDQNLDDIIVEATSKSKLEFLLSHEEKSAPVTPKEVNVKLPAAVSSATPKRKKRSSVAHTEDQLMIEPTIETIQNSDSDSVKFSQMSNKSEDKTPITPTAIPTPKETKKAMVQINKDSIEVQAESNENDELTTPNESLNNTIIATKPNSNADASHDKESEPSSPKEEVIMEFTVEKEFSVTPKSKKSPAKDKLMNESPIEVVKTPDTLKFQKAEEAKSCSPAAMPPPKGSKRRTVQFDKGSTPVQTKPTENEKHVDTPYPVKRMSTSEKSLNISDNDGMYPRRNMHFI